MPSRGGSGIATRAGSEVREVYARSLPRSVHVSHIVNGDTRRTSDLRRVSVCGSGGPGTQRVAVQATCCDTAALCRLRKIIAEENPVRAIVELCDRRATGIC